MSIRFFNVNDVLFLLQAARWTLFLSGIAFLGGGIAGVIVMLMRISPSRALRFIAKVYIELLQGTPLLMQLFVCFFLLTLVGVDLSATVSAAIALTLNASAFSAEIWRGSVEAIPRTQWEAAASIGMSRFEQVRHIIVPQALRIAIAPTVGLMVQIVKGTALTALIGFAELTRAGQLVSNTTYQPLAAYGTAALIYLAICFPLSALSQHLERRLHVGHTVEFG